MWKQIITIAVAVILAPASALCGFDYAPTYPVHVTELGDLVKIKTSITNNSDAPADLEIKKVYVLPTDDEDLNSWEKWSVSICVGLNCYRSDVDSVVETFSAGQTLEIFAYFQTQTMDGIGEATFTFTPLDEPGAVKTIEFATSTTGAGPGMIDVLIIQDNSDSDIDYYSDALPGDLNAAKWTATFQSDPSADDLLPYENVIWFTGDETPALSADDRATIAGYLDGGGRLMISGQQIAYDLCDELSAESSPENCEWVRDYLHATYQTENAGTTNMTGADYDVLGAGLSVSIEGGTGAGGQTTPDGIMPAAGGYSFLSYDGTNFSAGIRHASDDNKIVYLPFGFEGIADEAARSNLMARIFDFFADETGPVLEVAVLQNPYLTSYLDLYIVSDEPLETGSANLEVDGESVTLELVDGPENVWRSDYRLSKTGPIDLVATVRDQAGNETTDAGSFGAAKISSSSGGIARSVDGTFSFAVSPGSVERDTYILVFDGGDGSSQKTVGSFPEGAVLVPGNHMSKTGKNRRSLSYTVNSILPGTLRSAAEVIFDYDGTALDGASPDRLQIERAESGFLETWVDEARSTASASTDGAGVFYLAIGASGSASPIDPLFARLEPNFPNPFNPTTSVRFEIRAPQHVRLDVFDIAGRLVRRLVDNRLSAGTHSVIWDGMDGAGGEAASGVYFTRLAAGKTSETRKITLIR